MTISEHEIGQIDAKRAAIAATVRDFVENLPDRQEVSLARRQGEQICSILEPLGLPEQLVAAVRVYPLRRDGCIGVKDLQKLKVEGLPDLVQGLAKPEQYPKWSIPFMKIFLKTGLGRYYWNMQLKENEAYEDRFDRPFA